MANTMIFTQDLPWISDNYKGDKNKALRYKVKTWLKKVNGEDGIQRLYINTDENKGPVEIVVTLKGKEPWMEYMIKAMETHPLKQCTCSWNKSIGDEFMYTKPRLPYEKNRVTWTLIPIFGQKEYKKNAEYEMYKDIREFEDFEFQEEMDQFVYENKEDDILTSAEPFQPEEYTPLNEDNGYVIQIPTDDSDDDISEFEYIEPRTFTIDDITERLQLKKIISGKTEFTIDELKTMFELL